MNPMKHHLIKILKIPVVLICLCLDFYALVWLESFLFEKYDNTLRYMVPFYLLYITPFVIALIYFLSVGIRWIFGSCRKQMLINSALAVFGLIAMLFMRDV